ncbi:MAG: hypothetical protein HY072_08530 [Deltaproteobacteria bacterium]|nr:hypothetical protein [Deltaproteobacteria bacterium]
MIRFFVLLLFVSFSQVHAQDEIDLGGKVTKIEDANLVCTSSGNVFFIKTKSPERVWQADSATDAEGLEHVVVDFNTLRCPDCYNIETQLKMGDQSITFKMEVRGKSVKKKRKIMLTATMAASSDEDDDESAGYPDRKIKATCVRK